MHTNHRRQVWILVLVLFVIMLGYGIVIPIMPFYIDRLGAGGTELGLLVASYAVMRMVCGPVWGGLSDRVGRKPVLLIGILGYAVTMVWFGLATRLWMLFAARILSGVLSSATAPTTMAYIGDSTPGKERSGGMGLLGAAGGVGTIVGPALGGLLGGESLATPFLIAAGLSLLSLLLAALFLPESLPPEARDVSRTRDRIVDLGLWGRAILGPLGALFLLTFLSTCGLMVFANVFGLYALERFGYGTGQVGIILMVLGLASALAQGLLAGPLTRRFGERTIIRAGLLGTAAGLVLMLLAADFAASLLTTAFFGLATAIQVPALISWTSRRASMPQGIAMGLSNAFVSLGRIIGPLIGGVTFDLDIRLPYLSAAGVMFLGFVASLVWLPKDGEPPPSPA
ncbi:MAG: MFS transporter [Anaerolineales bacterium]|nr:MFS transporter [Anaerolineales bacterium]